MTAARRLIDKRGSYDAVSIAELARASNTSVGSFYNRYRDKDGLLHVLHLELCAEGKLTIETMLAPARWTTVEMPLLIGAFVEFAVTSYKEQHGLRRALLLAASTRSEFRVRAIELSRQTCSALTVLIASRYTQVSRDALRTAVDLCHCTVYGVLDQSLLYQGPASGNPLADATLTAELSMMCLAYLQARLGPSGG